MAPGAQNEEDVGAFTKHPDMRRHDRHLAVPLPLLTWRLMSPVFPLSLPLENLDSFNPVCSQPNLHPSSADLVPMNPKPFTASSKEICKGFLKFYCLIHAVCFYTRLTFLMTVPCSSLSTLPSEPIWPLDIDRSLKNHPHRKLSASKTHKVSRGAV